MTDCATTTKLNPEQVPVDQKHLLSASHPPPTPTQGNLARLGASGTFESLGHPPSGTTVSTPLARLQGQAPWVVVTLAIMHPA